MRMGLIGLGRMGNAIAQRLVQAGHDVLGFDVDEHAKREARDVGVTLVSDIAALGKDTRIIWLMVPHGKVVDDVLKILVPHLKAGDIVIDGGNSKFTDSIRRAKMLENLGIAFLDCGVSGGLQARGNGFSLMVGGDNVIYTKVHSLLAAIAAPGGLGHVGPSGAGHYVKMVHNGIEYALLQAYAEGFQLIRQGSFKDSVLDLEEITRVWNNGSIIRSWILELAHSIFLKDQKLDRYSGKVEATGMGKWTVEDAYKHDVPVRLIEDAVDIRYWSQETGGNYSTKVVALLRHEFGGHPVKKVRE